MPRPFELISLNMRISTEKDKKTLTPYDHTKLSNINTCPTWGIIRYSLHRTTGGANREMPLEAGAAAHDAFAAMNWWYAARYGADHIEDRDLVWNEGKRIFGEDRLITMRDTHSDTATDRTNLINFSLEALNTSGFYDDPSDRNRTIANISEGIITFCDRYDPNRYRIWNNSSTIGIECVFDAVVSIVYKSKQPSGITTVEKDIRITGKLDGLKHNIKQDRLEIHEYKTGSRLDNAWLSQWIMSHQITGYCAAATLFTDEDCNHAEVIGMQIPIGKNPMGGIVQESVARNPLKYEKWAEWLVHTVNIEETYRNYVFDAPRYTNSCNRYFRACSMLPFCDAEDREDQEAVLESMTIAEWSPLDD